MSNRKIPIFEATDAQLRLFATETLGLTLGPNPNLKRETILAKIRTQWTDDFITLDDAAVAKTVAVSPPADETSSLTDEEVWIEIQPGHDEAGDQPVFVLVNGRSILLPRGKPIPVKKRFVHALENAVTEVYQTNKEGSPVGAPRKVPRFPFSRVSPPGNAA